MQETWQEGYIFDEQVNGFHIFNHNYYIGGRGEYQLWEVVVIVLSKKFYHACKYSGSLPPIKTDTKGKYGEQLIELTLKLHSYDSKGKFIIGELFKPFVLSAYHTSNRHHSYEQHWGFNVILDTLLSRAPNNDEIIMGADVNCRIGRRDQE